MPCKSLMFEGILGLLTMLHCVPFQCSIKVTLGPCPGVEIPTAHTSLAETAATPERTLMIACGGFGLATMLHWVPSQCSISVCPMPLGPEVLPTAQISLVETAATAFKTLDTEGTFGLLTIFHCLPFQCSISVCAGPRLLLDISPTAQTSAADRAVTPKSLVSPASAPGLLAMFHWPQLAARAALAPDVRSNKRASIPLKMPQKRCELRRFLQYSSRVVCRGFPCSGRELPLASRCCRHLL